MKAEKRMVSGQLKAEKRMVSGQLKAEKRMVSGQLKAEKMMVSEKWSCPMMKESYLLFPAPCTKQRWTCSSRFFLLMYMTGMPP
jgi:hypothetical protein